MDHIANFGEAYVPPQVYTHAEETARWEAEEEFFRPVTQEIDPQIVRSFLVEQIIPHRYGAPAQPIDLEGRSSRLIITAERLYQERVIHFWNNGEQNVFPPIRGGPVGADPNIVIEHYPSCGPEEVYKVGETTIIRTHSVYATVGRTKWERLGHSFTTGVPSWNAMHTRLRQITGDDPDREKALAKVLINFAHNFRPLTRAWLAWMGLTGVTGNQIHDLHRIFFHVLITESAAWQSAHYYPRAWRIGMTVTFARSLILLREGHLTLEETFGNNSRYCIYSLQYMYPKSGDARQIAWNVDQKYRDSFRIDLTKEQALRDLREVYGVDIDGLAEVVADLAVY